MLPAVSPADVAPACIDGRQSGLNILAVDDDPAMSRMTALMLRKHDHRVEAVTSAEQALRRLAQQAFDVLMTDLRPSAGINGLQLAARVRQRWPSMRIVLVTGWGPAIDTPESQRRDLDAVLVKPYAGARLRNLVAGLAADIDRQREPVDRP
jgi:CheY-like chemotaxis protein